MNHDYADGNRDDDDNFFGSNPLVASGLGGGKHVKVSILEQILLS